MLRIRVLGAHQPLAARMGRVMMVMAMVDRIRHGTQKLDPASGGVNPAQCRPMDARFIIINPGEGHRELSQPPTLDEVSAPGRTWTNPYAYVARASTT